MKNDKNNDIHNRLDKFAEYFMGETKQEKANQRVQQVIDEIKINILETFKTRKERNLEVVNLYRILFYVLNNLIKPLMVPNFGCEYLFHLSIFVNI